MMKFTSIDYVIILFTLQISYTMGQNADDACDSGPCTTVIDYLAVASTKNPDVCLDPFERFCNLTIHKQPTLVQMKSQQVTERRESIFEAPMNWTSHKSPLIQYLLYVYSLCLESTAVNSSRERLVDVLTEHLHEKSQRQSQIAVESKVVYFEPLSLPVGKKVSSISSTVKAMNSTQLCYHEVARKYPYGIDRMYYEAYVSNKSQIEQAWNKMSKFIDQMKRETSHFYKLLTNNCPQCLGDPDSMKIKYAYPDFIFNDALLMSMYTGDIRSEEEWLMQPSPEPMWVLPVYPDAAWYNIGENALYITPIFFDPDLVHSTLPDAWNSGGFVPILRAYLSSLVQPELLDGRLDASPYLYVFRDLCTNGSTGSTFNQDVRATCLLDHLALEIMSFYSSKIEQTAFPTMNVSDLLNFRIYNDLCYRPPTDELMYQAFRDANGRIHNYDLIKNYRWNQPDTARCKG